MRIERKRKRERERENTIYSRGDIFLVNLDANTFLQDCNISYVKINNGSVSKKSYGRVLFMKDTSVIAKINCESGILKNT